MRNKLIQAALLFMLMLEIASCIVTTPYDRHASRMARPHSMMRRPRPVKANSRYSWSWNPFGYSSSQSREHWPHHHGERIARSKRWPRHYVPHPHYYKVKYRR